jgi:transposase
MRNVLRNKQWRRIESMLLGKITDSGRTAADNHLFVEAVLWIARTDAPWRDLPQEFGPSNSVYQRFARWSDQRTAADAQIERRDVQGRRSVGLLRNDLDHPAPDAPRRSRSSTRTRHESAR